MPQNGGKFFFFIQAIWGSISTNSRVLNRNIDIPKFFGCQKFRLIKMNILIYGYGHLTWSMWSCWPSKQICTPLARRGGWGLLIGITRVGSSEADPTKTRARLRAWVGSAALRLFLILEESERFGIWIFRFSTLELVEIDPHIAYMKKKFFAPILGHFGGVRVP